MMVMNTIFPHLILCIILKRYAPGLLSGLLLNVPIGLYILISEIEYIEIEKIAISVIVVSLIIISILPVLFRFGKTIDENMKIHNN